MSDRSSLVESDFTVSYSIFLPRPIGYDKEKLIPVGLIRLKLLPSNLREKSFIDFKKSELFELINKAIFILSRTFFFSFIYFLFFFI